MHLIGLGKRQAQDLLEIIFPNAVNLDKTPQLSNTVDIDLNRDVYW